MCRIPESTRRLTTFLKMAYFTLSPNACLARSTLAIQIQCHYHDYCQRCVSTRLVQLPKSEYAVTYRGNRMLQQTQNRIKYQMIGTTSVYSLPWHSSPVLTPEQTSETLEQNAVSVQFSEGNSIIQRYDSNQLFSNKPGEDRRAVAECVLGDGILFGVFDGHGGTSCAQAVSERLFNYIAAEILPFQDLPRVLKRLQKRELTDLVKWYRHPNEYKLQATTELYHSSLIRYIQANLSVDFLDDDTIADVLKTAFDRLDKDFSSEAMRATTEELGIEPVLNAVAGSCACVAYMQGRDLHVGNVGDCRAVLGRSLDNGQWEAVRLSVDHNAQNKKEVERIKAVHPPNESTTVIKNGRLLAELIPLRAFGNIRFKWTLQMQQRLLRTFIGYMPPKNFHSPPYLISTPEVMHHQITDNDKFLILATDGLWDMMSCEKAVQLVGEHMKSMKASGPYRPKDGLLLREIMIDLKERMEILKTLDTNSATHLIRYALCGVANDFDLNKLAEVLSLPDATARQHRDDMTVTVIYFNAST